jgi:hypothetical protein
MQQEIDRLGRAAAVAGPVADAASATSNYLDGNAAGIFFDTSDFLVNFAIVSVAAAAPVTLGSGGAAAITAAATFNVGGGTRGLVRGACGP